MAQKYDTDHKGRTALHNAVIRADSPTIRSLLEEHRGIIKAKDKAGNTALHLAVGLAGKNKMKMPCSAVRKRKGRQYVRIARILLDKGASAIVENKQGMYPGDYLRIYGGIPSTDGELLRNVKMPALVGILLKAEKGYRSKYKKQRIAAFNKLDKELDKELGW